MKLVSKICIGVGAGVLGVALIGAGTVYGIWHNEINSMVSIKKVIEAHPDNYAGNVYMMEMDGGFYFDDFLEQGGVSNDGDLIDFIVGNITKGLFEVNLNQPEIEVGCSSFTAINEENNHRLFGRNYDFAETNSLILRTNPGNGRHATISSVDLQFLSLDKGINSLLDRATAIAAAYAPLDGINDAGVSCGIYMSYQGPGDTAISTNQQTDKPDITSTTMLRLILDYADSVEEAIELVQQYDFHDSANTSFHYMIADQSGTSAILEWVNGTDDTDIDGSKRELKVYYNDQDAILGEKEGQDQFQYITNFIVTPDYYTDEKEMKGLDRYQFIQETINPDGKNAEGKMTYEEALGLLQDLGRRNWDKQDDKNSITVWSALYDLTDLSLTWVSNEEFNQEGSVFHLSLKD